MVTMKRKRRMKGIQQQYLSFFIIDFEAFFFVLKRKKVFPDRMNSDEYGRKMLKHKDVILCASRLLNIYNLQYKL